MPRTSDIVPPPHPDHPEALRAQGGDSPLSWTDQEVPISTRFDDPYFSMQDGLGETHHVFLGGNDLPSGLCDRFHIAELGFGTGLNLLVTLAAWHAQNAPGTLCFTSFEAYPLSRADMARALAAFPSLSAWAALLLEQWRVFDHNDAQAVPPAGRHLIPLPGLRFELIVGDARQTLPLWQGQADVWFLDGFSPAKNPELWDAALMREVGRHCVMGGRFATYTAAGHVRRALQEAGFAVERRPGYGHKRHMSVGRKVRSV